jgi:HEPN domain-containing protein
MDEAKQEETEQWLSKSQQDLEVAKILLQHGISYTGIAVYHCQQSVEKALKGYLTAKGTVFPKTHDLVALLELCMAVALEFDQWKTAARLLTPYATEFRYPTGTVEPTYQEAGQAVEMADSFMQFVVLMVLKHNEEDSLS